MLVPLQLADPSGQRGVMRPRDHNASCVCLLQRFIVLMYSTGEQPYGGTRLQLRLWHSGFAASQAGTTLERSLPTQEHKGTTQRGRLCKQGHGAPEGQRACRG